jgi:hypothetical protein
MVAAEQLDYLRNSRHDEIVLALKSPDFNVKGRRNTSAAHQFVALYRITAGRDELKHLGIATPQTERLAPRRRLFDRPQAPAAEVLKKLVSRPSQNSLVE